MTSQYPYNMILSGEYGQGKTLTMVSFLPHGKKYGDPIKRLVFDQELRSRIYQSPDNTDNAAKAQFAFRTVQKEGRVTGEMIYRIMENTKLNKWADNEAPDMIGIDDIKLFQEVFLTWLKHKPNALLVAKLYGKEAQRLFTSSSWTPWDAGAISIFKSFIGEWMIDMKAHDISFIGNTPMNNIWKDYNAKGNDTDGKPKMRVLGRSAKMLDVFTQHADVIWILDRSVNGPDGKKTLKALPTVTMDVFVPKASIPGLPEKFEWPGWVEVWKWHQERKFTADVTKLQTPSPSFDQEQMDADIKAAKVKLAKELRDFCTKDEIKKALDHEFFPTFTYEIASDTKLFAEFKESVKEQVTADRLEAEKAKE